MGLRHRLAQAPTKCLRRHLAQAPLRQRGVCAPVVRRTVRPTMCLRRQLAQTPFTSPVCAAILRRHHSPHRVSAPPSCTDTIHLIRLRHRLAQAVAELLSWSRRSNECHMSHRRQSILVISTKTRLSAVSGNVYRQGTTE